jgi:hypothetical protein
LSISFLNGTLKRITVSPDDTLLVFEARRNNDIHPELFQAFERQWIQRQNHKWPRLPSRSNLSDTRGTAL